MKPREARCSLQLHLVRDREVPVLVDQRELNGVAGGIVAVQAIVPLPPERRALALAAVERLGEHVLAVGGVDVDAFLIGIVDVGDSLGIFEFNRCDPAVTTVPSTIYVVTPGVCRQNLRSVRVVFYFLTVCVAAGGEIADVDGGLVVVVFEVAAAITSDELSLIHI